MKYFNLTFIEKTNEKDKWGNYLARCYCDCGKEVYIGMTYLKLGRKKSCGCIPNGRKKEPNAYRRHPLYRTWVSMRSRCNNPKVNNYHNYGGRGIKVCKEWQESFVTFIKDMGERPRGYTLDRIDNDGNYCRENCKWSTKKEQALNRRKS